MLFIMGFSWLICTGLWPCSFTDAVATLMGHLEWNGFTHYDTIFLLFLFIADISFLLDQASAKRHEPGENVCENPSQGHFPRSARMGLRRYFQTWFRAYALCQCLGTHRRDVRHCCCAIYERRPLRSVWSDWTPLRSIWHNGLWISNGFSISFWKVSVEMSWNSSSRNFKCRIYNRLLAVSLFSISQTDFSENVTGCSFLRFHRW